MIEANRNTFDESVSIEGKVVVDFWAPWCAPCKAMNPVLEELNKETTVVKVNADDEMELAKHYNVRSIPTLLIFEDGKEIKRIMGAMSLRQLKEELAT